MPELKTAVPISINQGWHNLKYVMASGDARLQWSVNNEPFEDVPDSVQIATTGKSVRLPSCRVQAVLTGDAKLYISKAD